MSTKNTKQSAYPVFAANFNIAIGYIGGDRRARSVAAETLGCTYENVRVWSEGHYLPKGEMLLKIKECYNVSIDWLLTGISESAAGSCIMPPGSDEFCSMLRDILSQNTDEQIKSALRTNLVAFKNSADKDREAIEKAKKMTEMEKKVDYLMQLYESKMQSGT